MQGIGLVNKDYNVFDGDHVDKNCTDTNPHINPHQYSYNVGILLQDTNGSSLWQERVDDLLTNIIKVFFPEGVAYEGSCEQVEDVDKACTMDMKSSKGYVHCWMATTAQVTPFVKDRIIDVLKTSTAAAVKQRTGGANGRTCGFRWVTEQYDGTTGAGRRR
ncbi:hypothetical protein NKR23_g11299 [Pleurostoma richardsiae]|uniref:mannan endo-1,6-alpha-mannosidase n=1 Tax=Pleurostoma richardsiae TaxID=41990 RepID=A0AA38RAL7_9PEZI|nr:hypothetical protein NKR23_g11299 [Pleurostoma richardsiae]